MTNDPDRDRPRTPDEQFVVRLAALHYARDRAMSSLLRWQPNQVFPQQLVDVARVTEGSGTSDYEVRAATGKAFASYHSGRSQVDYGYPGSNVGAALRRVGTASQGYGPRNPSTDRLLQQLATAETFDDLTLILGRICTQLRAEARAPHWGTLLADLRDWHTPATRTLVRLRWSQAFYTTPAKKVATK